MGDPPPVDGAWDADDTQLALYTCYELHYRSFAGVDERWEWNPELLAFRATLESVFEDGITAAVGASRGIGRVEDQLWTLARGGTTPAKGHRDDKIPSLSEYVAESGTIDQVRELAVHRSAYQLKEAAPHTWAIPRLSGAPKAAMVEIQADEYGGGVESNMHCSLFAMT
ncbi:MAG TPA: iron-containing redox enzyme family protein, partial [Acidimicrobiales bacterium]|nr:iron-containing redox enzyme family protein [Acidimicrobiales bacterium]